MAEIRNLVTHPGTLAMFAVIAWMYYRRIRRHFGRQPYHAGRTVFRMVLVSVIAVLLAVAAFFMPHVWLGMLVGALIGVGIGWLGLYHTHAEWIDGVGSYTPNPWIGAGMSLLLIGRLVWRGYTGAFTGGTQQTMQQASPLTLALAAALIAYALVYSYGLWWRMKQLAAQHPAAPGATVQ